ncbi:Bug family tripartite tricarboxylate transporter substrate binding protein [Noviherbaspirillum saxi]|uniref:Tripartite tricarboxylate transporter substrate binding protein n=1 Tax=Noviherbaspirillum saxi TaxID=2320863 RepID=A0A3A3FKR6_9BURK|nr:tripartite tricarboxylate transporter substrate binding protein [Noviherbaspirillum saxi]RJF95897.1 tripartite tricarboxylate transporter substrate binding protein [Noviherbaspirillum saxi]
MHRTKRTTLRSIGILVAGLALSITAFAQQFPVKPVTLLVPYPAGGLSDFIARTVNTSLSKNLGQPVIVENVGGGSGSIAAQRLLNSPSDGHLIFQGSPNELILAPLANAAIKFKSEDFRLVQMISTAHIAFLVRKDLPVNDVDGFIAYARKMAKEGKSVTYASVGPGSFYHLLGEHMSKVTDTPMVHVPYRGAAPAEQDLISGNVDMFLAPYGKKYDSLHKQGKLKVLAMLNHERIESVKEYPAISESKVLKDFTFNIWTGYFVKTDTPEHVVRALHKAITETLNDPVVRSSMESNSQLMPQSLPLSAVGKAYAEGTAQFRAIAKSINLQPQ